jgi:hypothetical protein
MNQERETSPASRLLPLGAIVIICFVAGVLSVLATGQGRDLPSSASPTEARPWLMDPFGSPGEDDQIVVLILGAEELSDKEPDLLAVWLATYRPPGKDIFLFGFPIDWKAEVPRSQALRQLFAWSETGDVSRAFMDALPLRPDVVLTLDCAAFASLVDFLGGTTLDGSERTGAQLIAEMERLKGQPQALLTLQARALEGLVESAAALGAAPDLTPLLALIPDHAHSSLPALSLASNLSPLLPLRPEAIHMQLLIRD